MLKILSKNVSKRKYEKEYFVWVKWTNSCSWRL